MELATQISGPVAVIGDVHGQTKKLDLLIDRLFETPGFEDRWVVFIGDLVDRGPDPKNAIEILLELRDEHPKTTCVAGNHELAMSFACGLIDSPEYANWDTRWTDHYGAEQTFESYGAEYPDCEALAAAMPEEHRDFLRSLPWAVESPEAIFVHAGLDPNQPFEMQKRVLAERDFTLQRPPWLCSKSFTGPEVPSDCEKIVVSGHVPQREVVAYPQRILCDTTGGVTGHLSCVLLPEMQVIDSGPMTPPKAEPAPPAAAATPAAEAAATPATDRYGRTPPKWYEFWK